MLSLVGVNPLKEIERSSQHFFVPLLENANRKSVFLILLVCPDANKLAEQIKMQATKVHLHPLSAELVRTKLLLICQQERKLHEIFLAHYFISYANVLKVFLQRQPAANNNSTALTPAVPPFPLSIVRMSEPLRRCPKCTLVPPCSHLPLEKLFVKIERMRALYPRNGLNSTANPTTGVASAVASSNKCDQDSPSTSGSTICPSFRRRGVCSNIRTLGRCRYAHPLALHTVDTNALVSRCRAHTLPLPCLHCSNVEELTAASRKERMVCEQLKREVLHNRQALVDLETQRFMFIRDRGKAVKWGSAKKEADEQLAKLDTELHEAKVSVKRQEQKLSAHQIALVKLQDDAVHGRSHGCGKGNGRLQPERSEYREVEARAQHRGGGHKKKSAVIAAV
ncbi:hypothetical protein BBJ28_00004959 [Nothophytophthora sp. Chile5]|nr:hypothetical protein BBJ28_00004959 [Nothophytophthora sp. Chile5]